MGRKLGMYSVLCERSKFVKEFLKRCAMGDKRGRSNRGINQTRKGVVQGKKDLLHGPLGLFYKAQCLTTFLNTKLSCFEVS